VYLRALETIPGLSIHYGHYLSHVTRMPLARRRRGGARTVEVVKTEEKGSDVNLATFPLLDAFQGDCEVTVVLSNDSDLKLPIEVARNELGIEVGVVNPHPPAGRSRALRPTFFKQLRASALAACQFPPVLTDAKTGSPATRSRYATAERSAQSKRAPGSTGRRARPRR
jgi:hypothetical protein